MGDFVETIRRVGIFMIVAQVVIHLAPGKQYEKYIKLIAGVIVLAQLISPFYQTAEENWDRWAAEGGWNPASGEEGLEEIMEEKKLTRNQMVQQNIQDEIKTRLNNSKICTGYYVKSVELVLKNEQTENKILYAENNSQSDWQFQKIVVVMQKQKGEEKSNAGETKSWDSSIEPVRVETVTWEEKQEEPADRGETAAEAEEQKLAAQISKELEIEESCVEVRIYGDI